ncbi:hypothetical protein [Paenibacillus sp. IHB B 3415]|uniref:hypothetical protein n=1 Tax=Paenibacillus sp. IHB B 3415 TaxID=867080 RepID=UPI000AABBB70|nr:hypothetical protein [Paenibacillus sp. IHB B 3415]
MMNIRLRDIGLSVMFVSAVFFFGRPDVTDETNEHIEHNVEALKYYNNTSAPVIAHPISADNKLPRRHEETSEQNLIIAEVDSGKSPVQLIPVYKNGVTPRIELVPSR